jgi:autotransporter adhesin
MRTKLFLSRALVIAIVFGAIWFVLPQGVFAHCDTLDGPVVITAKKALEKGDVTPVLKWVKKDYEQEIRVAFQKTLAVRAKGPEAKELADMYFFGTLVRLHRAGEGAPYTGLKAAGTVDPAVAAADRALENGSIDGLVKNITSAVSSGIRERFVRAIEKKQHADESINAGREFVEAYVEFVHYVERLHLDAAGQSSHHAE